MARLRRSERGQALVEFALVVPIFILLILGLFDMGRAVLYFSTISNASREAVRLAIVDQSVPDIRQEAVDSAEAVLTVEMADVDVDFLAPDLTGGGPCSAAPIEIGCIVRVEVIHRFDPVIPFLGVLQISAETHQPIERKFVSP